MTLNEVFNDYERVVKILDRNLDKYMFKVKNVVYSFQEVKTYNNLLSHKQNSNVKTELYNNNLSLNIWIDMLKDLVEDDSLLRCTLELGQIRLSSDYVHSNVRLLYNIMSKLLIKITSYHHSDYIDEHELNKEILIFMEDLEQFMTGIHDFQINSINYFETYHALLEPIPWNVFGNKNYTDIIIKSSVKLTSLKQISNSISYLADIIDSTIYLLPDETPKDYYIRKIETGSLTTIITGGVALAVLISKVIEWSLNTYSKYQETQKTRQEIIGLEIDNFNKLTDLKIETEKEKFLAEKILNNAIKYIKLNEEVNINGTIYYFSNYQKSKPMNKKNDNKK